MKPIILTDQTFDSEVLKSDKPVLVDFWAPWCGPCRVVSPLVEELAEQYDGKMKFGKLNVDENPQAAMRYQIFSIPNLRIFKAGQIVDEVVGAVSKAHIESVLKKYI